MVPTDDKTADRWLRNYPNATVFTLLGIMVAAIVLAIIFFAVVRPNPAAPTKTSAPPAPASSSPQ
jgi:hypothetical protein